LIGWNADAFHFAFKDEIRLLLALLELNTWVFIRSLFFCAKGGTEMPQTRSHGQLRGAEHASKAKSSTNNGRFGRMFRWLDGHTYEKEHLKLLAEMMIQLEHAHLRQTPPDQAQPLPPPPGEASEVLNFVSEGPDIVTGVLPPNPAELLDTPYGEPEPGDENPAIPAGYTYLGQFIDHDITFDPASSLQKINDPDATEDFRTPRLDLDSLYGRGPDDQPYLYQDDFGIKLLHGRKIRTDPAKIFLTDLHDVDRNIERKGDLPRNIEGRALIGDPRNDENNIICQIQALFINFHNKVVDKLIEVRPLLAKRGREQELFLEAQRIVRWTYQYIVMNDYLPKTVGHHTWNHVYVGRGSPKHPEPNLEFYKPQGSAYMPVEFSVAAFRFGHSQVRPSYALRTGKDSAIVGGGQDENGTAAKFARDPRYHRIPIFSDALFRQDLQTKDKETERRSMTLDGFGPLFPKWEIDWRLFFSQGDMPTSVDKKKKLRQVVQTDVMPTQPGYRIDTQLVDPLAMLPPNIAKSGNMPDHIPSLGYRNLLRGSSFELPSGQDVARALDMEPLSEKILWEKISEKYDDPKTVFNGPKLPNPFKDPKTNPFAYRAPLWFYILREAELTKRPDLKDDSLGGHHLGPVGGRIVAEVLVGLVYHDHHSYLYQDSTWEPDHELTKSGFDPKHSLKTMYDLIHWVMGDRMGFEPS
jgi:Animal haem peroxidase